jgi:UDP-N-acetylbacillosamine N-acetyltransferase
MKKLLILGAGGYGKTVLDVAQQLGCYEKIAFLDDNAAGTNILGKCEEYFMFADEYTDVYPAFGNNETRIHWLERLEEEGISVPTLVHPRAYVSPTASIGTGNVVLPMAVVNTDVHLGNGCIVNIGALVDHDSILEDGVHLAPGAVVKAENRIPEKMKVESNQVIENREYPL